MAQRIRLGTTLLALLLMAACVRRVETRTVTVEGDELRQEELMRAASNLPSSFTVVSQAATPRDCPPSLRDDAQQTTLTLRRSLVIPVQTETGASYQSFGDYAVAPAGKYGEQQGEGVRVDCARVRGVGIIKLREQQ
jgi:hypothetical protein